MNALEKNLLMFGYNYEKCNSVGCGLEEISY